MEAEFRQLLAELEMLANGSAQSFDRPVTGSKDRSPIMYQREEPLHEQFARRWEQARTLWARELVIRAATQALALARRSPAPERILLEPGSLAWKRDIANDRTTGAGELARLCDISRQTVYRYRELYGEERVA
jgi:hypothetical protein